MRLLATLWVVLMVSVTLQAQNITYAEYYFNEEPGLGNGTELSITAAEQVTINETLPISELEDGRHKLFVRARDDNGKWSTVYNRTFLKTTLPDEENPQVTFAEFYFNEETGLGEGNELPVKTGNVVEIGENIDLSDLENGRHKLFVRARDDKGQWSTVYNRTFLKTTLPGETKPQIMEVEYYFNEEPGLGEGTDFTITPNNPVEIEETLALAELPIGENQVYVRAKDSNGNWSQPFVHDFEVEGILSTVNLISPEKNGTTTKNPVFKWNEVENAADYEFQLDSLDTFNSEGLLQTAIADTTFQASDLDIETTYHWRVKALNESGESKWSEPWNFTTVVEAPGVVTLVSPENSSVDVPIRPVFEWNAADNATSYHMQLSAEAGFETFIADSAGITGQTFEPVSDLAPVTDYFWRVRAENGESVSGWSDVFTFRTAMATSVDGEDGIPAQFTLEQNYPNPFNPGTVIEFGLSETSDVRLEVFDMIGQRVAVLVDEQKAAGTHQVQFDASDLSSGMYIFRIRAGNFTQTRKMTLIK